MKSNIYLAAAVLLGLTACGGGGKKSPPPPPPPPANQAPSATAQAVATDEDTDIAITLTGSDPEGSALTFTIGTAPANGTLSGTAPDVTYTPNADFNGADSFTFTVNDGSLTSPAATVDVTVNAINDAPVADDQAVATGANIPLDVTLTGSDVESDPLTFAIMAMPTNGTLSGTAPDVTYTPDLNFDGADSFTYVANDGTVDSAEATVTITVNAAAAAEALWRFEEGAGTAAADDVGDADATVNGATWATGASGNGLDFDGVNDFVVVDDAQQLNFTGTELSLVAWINPRDGGEPGDGSRVISKATDSAGTGDIFAMAINDYRLRFIIGNDSMDSFTIFRLNEWIHVAMVYNGVDMRIYIDGVLDQTTPLAKTDLIPLAAQAVHIGRREGDAQFYGGLIDEAQVLNRALSAAEVANLAAAITPPDPVPGTFHPYTDITVAAGVANGGNGGRGVMFADVTGDGRPDLYTTKINTDGVPRSDFFFRNINGATFAEEGAARGLDDSDDGGSSGSVFADLDNDGDLDLFNGSTWTNLNPSTGNPVANDVYQNDGTGNFTDQTSADILAVALESRGVTAFDMDNDGDLDLFGVASSSTPGTAEAYINNGGLLFNTHAGGDLTASVAMHGVLDTDYDGDGDIDIIAGDASGGRVTILNNDGTGVFTRISAASLGINHSAFHGISTADFDNDGDLDLLLVTDGNGHLYDRDSNTGMYVFSQTLSNIEGWMGGFADLDNDGDQDLVFAGDERVFLNKDQATGTFQSAQSVPVAGIREPLAIAFADIDNDGDVDFVISAKDSRNYLVRNDVSIDPNMPNWLKVALESPQCQAGAYGAKVRVWNAGMVGVPGNLVGLREARGNNGYLAQNDPVQHFGLAGRATVDVVVDWLDGTQTSMLGVAANQTITIDACP